MNKNEVGISSRRRSYAAKFAAILAAMLAPITSHAALGSAQGTVGGMFTYGDGRVLVYGFNFSNWSCSNNGGFVVYGNHPQFSRLMAVILAAKATGATLSVVAKTDNCWYPEITQDSTTYIYTNP